MVTVRHYYVTFLAIVVIIIAAFGGALGYFISQRNLTISQTESEMLRLAHIIHREYDMRIFENARSLVIALSQVPEIKNANNNPNACNEMVAALYASLSKLEPVYTTFGAVNLDGVITCGVPIPQGISVADRPYIQRVFQTKDFAVGEYQIGRLSGKPSLNVGYPIFDKKGEMSGVAVVAVDLGWLNETAKSFELLPSSSFIVVDKNGTVLLHYPSPENYVGKSIADTYLFGKLIKGDEGKAEASDIDGVKRLWGFVKITEIGDAYVLVGAAREDLLAPFEKIFLRNMGVVGLMAVIAFIFIYADVKRHNSVIIKN